MSSLVNGFRILFPKSDGFPGEPTAPQTVACRAQLARNEAAAAAQRRRSRRARVAECRICTVPLGRSVIGGGSAAAIERSAFWLESASGACAAKRGMN